MQGHGLIALAKPLAYIPVPSSVGESTNPNITIRLQRIDAHTPDVPNPHMR